MPVTIQDLATLQTYLEGLLQRADHHAKNVENIVLPLIGAVVWRANAGSIEVRTHAGEMTNVLYCTIKDRTFAFSFEHKAKAIQMKESNLQGAVLETFTNATSPQVIREFFKSL